MRKYTIITEIIVAVLMVIFAVIRIAMGEYMLAVHNILWAVLAGSFAAIFWRTAKDEKKFYVPRVTAHKLIKTLTDVHVTVATAESCTGGLVAKSITDIPGASEVFQYGLVTYSNEAKHKLLGVRNETLDEYTAVSEATAIEMARGAMEVAGSAIGLSVTGYAGGSAEGTENNGLVWIAVVNTKGYEKAVAHHWKDCSRKQIREAALGVALDMIYEAATV